MKTLPNFIFLAALAAFLFAPLSFEWSFALLFTAGIVAILAADYTGGRKARWRAIQLAPAATEPVSAFRLAA